MIKRKKVLTSALMLTLSLAGLSACDIESLNKAGAQIDLNVNLDEKVDLNVMYPNSGMQNSEFSSGRTTKYFEELTGYKVNYEQCLSDQTNVIQNILASELPYHMVKMESSTYFALVSSDAFVDLKPALEKYGQNLLNTIPQYAWDAVTIDGKIFAIPEVGFGQMRSSALVWNKRQLEEVGISKIPETMDEMNTAFYALQNHFSKNNSSYHAFAMQSASSYIEPIAAAFEINKDFYEDENGNIKHAMYQEKYVDYMSYLNDLVVDQVISMEWEGYTGANIVSLFAQGNIGCGYMPYWNINSLVTSLAANSDFSSEDEARASLGWSLDIRGDGTNGSINQSKAKTLYYKSIGYYISIPAHMAEYGAYVIDWCDKRITESAFEGYRLGDEGVHFNYVDESDPDAITVTIAGEKKSIKLTNKYNIDILPTSMYQTGVNPAVAKELWILSEQSYKCWKVLVETDFDNIVGNAMSLTPYIKGWSEIDEAARAKVITYEQKFINSSSKDKFNNYFSSLKNLWEKNYWTEEVNTNVQNWYKNKSN